jgi:drug/metabolite transporter (DMT)-like permease
VSFTVFGVVLAAACLHASWNAIVKSASDKLLTTILVAGSAAGVSAVLLPWMRAPALPSWPFIGASAALQVVYFVVLASAYRTADMSQAYPLMRGAAPLIVACLSTLSGESISGTGWLGLSAICAGILSIALGSRVRDQRGMALALLNAFLIASYTFIDGTGVRRSGAPASYTLAVFLLGGLPLVVWAIAVKRTILVPYAIRHWRLGMVGGVGSTISYGLALWAMTLAPIAVVAALRETSILFGTAIAGLVLRERLDARRVVSACIIAGGAVILRLA